MLQSLSALPLSSIHIAGYRLPISQVEWKRSDPQFDKDSLNSDGIRISMKKKLFQGYSFVCSA